MTPFTRGTWILLAMLALVGAAQVAEIAPVQRLQGALFDTYQRLLPRDRGSAPVTVVAIDEHALRARGQWPWPRTLMAELIERIAGHGPASIALDAFFPESDRLSPAALAERIPGLPPDAVLRLRALPSNDAVFAATIAKHRVVLGISAEMDESASRPVRGASVRLASDGPLGIQRFPASMQSVPILAESAGGTGLLNTGPAERGARTLPLFADVGGTLVPNLGLEALRLATNGTYALASTRGGMLEVKVGDMKALAQPTGERFLRLGRLKPDLYVSAGDVLAGRVDARSFRDKIVLVAITGLGLIDYKLSPLGELVPGAEFHVQLIEQLFDGVPLYRYPLLPVIEALVMLLAGAALGLAAWRLPTGRAVAAFAACIGVAAGVGLAMFAAGVLVDVATPIAAWTLAFGVALALSLRGARRAREKAVYMFSRFLNPHVVQELLRDEAFASGGEDRELTLLFSDIRNFTAMSAGRSPAEVVRMLNRYFSAQVEVIFRNQGVLDKFIGDAVMVFWGAPLEQPDHAQRAVACALEMELQFEALRGELGLGGHEFDIGIGIHSGPAVVGLIGSERRREYTAIGSTVNVASRVEGLTKDARRRILVTSETVRRCGDSFRFERVGAYAVKGLEEPIEVYEPIRREP